MLSTHQLSYQQITALCVLIITALHARLLLIYNVFAYTRILLTD
jgi:hypothetical protein